MKMKNLFPVLLTLVLLVLFSSCQEDGLEPLAPIDESSSEEFSQRKRTCISHEHTQHLMQDADYSSKRQKMLQAFEKVNLQRVNFKAQCSSPVLVPVAIHFQGVSNPDAACLRQLAITQINILNDDYAGTNSDISKWTGQAASAFPGVSNGEACLKFVIADQNHPSGYGLNNGDLAVTVNRTQGDQVDNWSGYVNIYVMPNTGALGYAPLGGQGNGDGVVIDASAFGSGQGCSNIAPESPFNLGRTLTHEMGHYLLLDHIWGDGCGVDDEVSDTPDQAQDHSGCPSLSTSSCGSTDMHMNYMDYTNDECMYMFSAGQASRMTNYVTASLGALTNNVSNVYSGSANTGGGNTDGGDTSDDNTDDNTDDGTTDGGGNTDGGDTDSSDNGGGDTDNGGTDTDNGDVGTDEGTACASPTTSTVEEINPSKVKIDWADAADAIRYQVRYRVEGGGSWSKKGAANSQKNLNNLTADLYEYQIRTRCVDGWQAWSAVQTFDLSVDGGGDDEGADEGTDFSFGTVDIQVTLDDYGSETSWELYDASNSLIASGGPYEDGKSGQIESTLVDLEDGCYEIDLLDAFGDGMCCDYGNGGLEVLDADGQSLVSFDGNFGTYELVQFCVENGQARITKRERDSKKVARGKKK